MRLIDQIIAEVGGKDDRASFGAISAMALALKDAQCFELSPDVVEACSHVAISKPSSLFSAMPLTRLPYQRTWIEWRPIPDPAHLTRECSEDKPVPMRMGCLFECFSPDNLAEGIITWAWSHGEKGLMILPFAVQFDWRGHGNVLDKVSSIADAMSKMPDDLRLQLLRSGLNPDVDNLRAYVDSHRLTPNQAGKILKTLSVKWAKLADNTEEQIALVRLMERIILLPSPHCFSLFMALDKYADREKFEALKKSWDDDIQGEPTFALAFIIMLNATGALDRIPDDFTRLNRRRALSNKLPLRSFIVTHLSFSKTRERQADAQGISRASARRHLVRGHFKVRTTGIFWWSPFIRGSGEAAPREKYRVRA